jgi:hypothetical protein
MNKQTLVGALAAFPIVVAAAVLVTLEAARAFDPQSGLFTRPAAASLAEALDRGDLVEARTILRREPGTLLWVSHPDLTGGVSTLVPPLLWAAATGNDDAVRMLLGLGHDPTRGSDRYAACLSRALGRTSTAELLEAYGHPTDGPCPTLDSRKPALLAVLRGGRPESGVRNPEP